jgi:hypothetical protein
MGIGDAVIAGPCYRVLVDAKACVKIHAPEHTLRVSPGHWLLGSRVSAVSKLLLFWQRKKRAERLGWAGVAQAAQPYCIRSIPSEIRGNGGWRAKINHKAAALVYSITQCLPPVRPRGWATS